jgi:hypothetical protein
MFYFNIISILYNSFSFFYYYFILVLPNYSNSTSSKYICHDITQLCNIQPPAEETSIDTWSTRNWQKCKKKLDFKKKFIDLDCIEVLDLYKTNEYVLGVHLSIYLSIYIIIYLIFYHYLSNYLSISLCI